MRKTIIYTAAAALLLFGLTRPTTAQEDKENPDKKREDIFGKPFHEQVEDAVDKGCEWLKKQQGIDPIDPKPVFGKFPENPPLYGQGEPHRYLIARTAFPIQALCKSGCFVDDPAIDKAMNWLRENYTENGAVGYMQGFVGSSTYEDATVLNAVEAYYISKWEADAEGLTNPSKRFKTVEDENGKKQKVPITRWGTEEKGAKKKKKERNFKLEKKDQKLCEIAVKALEARFRKAYGGGGWRYAKPNMGENDPEIDVSATQYAILGLKAATRLGIRYDKKILVEVFRFLRVEQDKDGPVVKAKWKKSDDGEDEKKKGRGTSSAPPPTELKARGWGYARKSKHAPARDTITYGSMTAAAVNALILIRDELVEDPSHMKAWEKMEAECNQMIGDGMAWMINNWTMTENPRVGMHRFYYYLYTIERMCMLGGFDEVGGHDWYMEGARDVLLKQQEKSGMWDVQSEIDPSDIYNTCYALLFLKRASTGVDRPPPVLTGGDGDE